MRSASRRIRPSSRSSMEFFSDRCLTPTRTASSCWSTRGRATPHQSSHLHVHEHQDTIFLHQAAGPGRRCTCADVRSARGSRQLRIATYANLGSVHGTERRPNADSWSRVTPQCLRGTPRVFDTLSLIFREFDGGFYVAHAYRSALAAPRLSSNATPAPARPPTGVEQVRVGELRDPLGPREPRAARADFAALPDDV